MISASYISDRFASGLPYESYLRTGTDEQRRRWNQVYDAARLTDAQRQSVGGFVREMKILVFSGIWSGDCVEQCPLIHRITQANPQKIDLRFIERPKEGELIPELRINGGNRVPVVLFLSEDNEWCATVSASHQVRDLGAVQSSHRLIKRLFEPCSSLQLVKSLRLLMSCTQYNRTVQSQSQLTLST